jgi:hypothetical protein
MTLQTELKLQIQRLSEAIAVCNESPQDPSQGYPYATGYSRSAMNGVMDDLIKVLEGLEDDKVTHLEMSSIV